MSKTVSLFQIGLRFLHCLHCENCLQQNWSLDSFWSFFLPKLLFTSINLPYGIYHTICLSKRMFLVATHCRHIASWSLFYRFFFGRRSFELVLNWFSFLTLVESPLVILIVCMTFLSLFPEVKGYLCQPFLF